MSDPSCLSIPVVSMIEHHLTKFRQQVLSEVSRPRKIFAKSTIAAMVLVSILFILVNVAYVSHVGYTYDCRGSNTLASCARSLLISV